MAGAGYGTSGAPVAGEVTLEQRSAALADVPGTKAAEQQLKDEEAVVGTNAGLVGYVAAPEHANKRWLVKKGTPVKTAMAAGGSVGIIPLVTREGDIWAKFVNGVLVTDVPEVIDWCDEHPQICRRSDDPATKGWATLQELSTRRANRERLLDPSDMNADETFPVGLGNGDGDLRDQAAKPGSAGGQLVESAETSKQAAEQERAARDVS